MRWEAEEPAAPDEGGEGNGGEEDNGGEGEEAAPA